MQGAILVHYTSIMHSINCGLVYFGWPRHYYTSLAANMPVGLSALLLGAVSMNLLDRIHFDGMVERLVPRVLSTTTKKKGILCINRRNDHYRTLQLHSTQYSQQAEN